MFEYKTEGVCSKKIEFAIENDTLKNVCFTSGCPGNLTGISRLVEGMKITDVITKLDGIKCGARNTSCPAQLAKALKQQLENNK